MPTATICFVAVLSLTLAVLEKTNASTDTGPDADLYEFVTGEWIFTEAACLSGTPPQWEADISKYQRTMDISARRNIISREYFESHLMAETKSRFTIQAGVMKQVLVKVCNPGSAACQKAPDVISMLSKQGDQLWTLTTENDAGVCPARDIFIAKFRPR